MKCCKCGNEFDISKLKNGMCKECFSKVSVKKNKKRRKKYHSKKSSFVNSILLPDEKIIKQSKISNLVYIFITIIFAISIVMFPRTILEYFFNNNRIFFLILIFNILLFFFGIFNILYYSSREIYLTDKRILAKWGIFKVKILKLPLNRIESIEAPNYIGLEFCTPTEVFNFDFISNSEKFRLATIEQIQQIITTATDEKVLKQFSHKNALYDDINSKKVPCKCCGEIISRESLYCIHCGQPLPENEQEADLFTKILSFIFPPVGLFLFLINIAAYPKFARQCLTFSISSIVIALAIYLSILSIL